MHLPLSDNILLAVSETLLLRILKLGVTMPFLGALIRLRANYTPRRVQLPDDPEAASESTVVEANSYFRILERVYSAEGLVGFYKGIMPSIAEVVLDGIIFVISVLLGSLIPIVQIPPPSPRDLWPIIPNLLLFLLFAAVPAALHVIRIRSILTRYRLRALNLRTAIKVLLSPAERTNPLRLYQLPGVVLITILSTFIYTIANVCWLFLIHELIRRGFEHPWGHGFGRTHIVYRLCGLGMLVVVTALLTPLDVMRVRLSMQRAAAVEAPAAQQEQTTATTTGAEPEAESELLPPVYNAEQDVIETRAATEQPPYTSFGDCAKKIVEEEGGGTLYRGWWITALTLFPVFLL